MEDYFRYLFRFTTGDRPCPSPVDVSRSTMKTIALIPAAGSGSRMQADVSKQYLLLDGKPLLAHTLQVFAAHPAIDAIYLIVPPGDLDYCRREIVERHAITGITQIVAGGAERQDSVANGLAACGAADDDIILIHDGARPFVSSEIITAAIAAARQFAACTVGVPVKDTIKRVIDGIVTETPERCQLWQVQTPQAFRYDLLRRAHVAGRDCGGGATDDAVLVERLGHPVTMVAGSYTNLKITTPEDLVIARALHRERTCAP